MVSVFAPPVFANEEQTQQARMLYRVICGTVLITIGIVSLVMIQQPTTFSRGVSTAVFITLLGVLLLHLNQRGQTRVAGMLFAGGLILLITALAVTAGGVRSPGVTMYCVIVLMTGLVLDQRAGAIAALVCAGLGFGLLMAERFNLLPQAIQYSSATIWLLSCLYLGVVVVLLRLPTMLITTALIHAETELAERKRAEQMLEENQQLLETMIENTPAAVAMLDTDMRYIAYSIRWLTDYRLGFRDLRGLSHYDVFPEINEDWKAIHRRCLAGAKESRDEDPFIRADGTKDIVRWVVEPWRKGNGEIGGITMFTEVITDRIRAREERRTLRNQLLQAQKIEALGTLAGGIAHDFNNVLAMIGTNAELGLAVTQPGERAHTSFDEIVKATARAKDVVRQILFFSRGQDSAQNFIFVIPIIEDALRFLRATLPANVELKTTLQPSLPPVLANAAQIYQILINLGTNAGHAMRDGGVLSVTADRIHVTKPEAIASGDLRVGEYVCVAVGDTGIGMSPETLDRIFEPFFTTKGVAGTGLGLSVVHGLVKDHRGAIKVESEIGRGSTFYVYLPASRAAAVPSQKESESAPGHGEHIMYIDDEQALGSAVKRVLELLGYRCSFYADPETAVEAFRKNPAQFDAVISDMTMPHLSGIEVAKALKAIRPDIPIVLTSGRTSRGTETEAFCLGVKAWISKPATIEELSRVLDKVLRRPGQMSEDID